MSLALPPKTLLRRIELTDAPGLVELIREAGPGLATLPSSIGAIEQMVAESDADARPSFVLQRLDTGAVVGLSSIIAKLPDVAHTVTCKVWRDGPDVKLRPDAAFVGCSEMCTLFLTPGQRGGGNGRLLSLGRFFEVANHPERFADRLIVELRGVLDEEGVSPLWRAVCEHIFGISHIEAHRNLKDDPAYLADRLTDDGWLDLSTIPAPLRDLLGRVHQNTEPARRLLLAEGFADTGYVDLLDAGPVMVCERDQARLVRKSKVVEVREVVDTDAPRDFLISTVEGPLRCCRGAIDPEGRIAAPAAKALGAEPGTKVRFAPQRPMQPTSQGES